MIAGHCRLRVRYSDTDAMAVAHHSRHLSWFEVGRTELMRSAGSSYASLEHTGLRLPLIEAQVSYLAPIRYDEVIEIATTVSQRKGARLAFSYEIRTVADGSVVATGSTRHALVDSHFRPVRFPDALSRILDGDGRFDSSGTPC